jgi:hypothetical protein
LRCSHTNTSPCTLNTECDARQRAPREARQKRGTQDSPIGAFETQNPACPGGTPSGGAAAMGCPRSAWPPLEPRGFAALQVEEREARYNGRDRWTWKVVDVFVQLALVQWAVTPHVYKERLDFPCNKSGLDPRPNPSLGRIRMCGSELRVTVRSKTSMYLSDLFGALNDLNSKSC